MKKIIKLFFGAAMTAVVVLGNSAFTGESDVETMRDSLIRKGMPEKYFSYTTDEEIRDLYNAHLNEEEIFVEHEELSLNESSGDISLYGSISETMLTIDLYRVYNITYISNSGEYRIDNIQITVDYTWNTLPVIMREDAVSVNWDSSVFVYKAGSFSLAEYFNYYSGETMEDKTAKYKTLTNPDTAVQGGIGFSIDLYTVYLGNSTFSSVYECYGHAAFTILPTQTPMYRKRPSDSVYNTTSVNLNYTHNRTPIGGSVSFTVAGFGVSINAPSLSDSTSRTVNIQYRY